MLLIVHGRSAVIPGSGIDGDNIECDDCDILQCFTYNSCFDPPLNYGVHRTPADFILHTTLTTNGTVGWNTMHFRFIGSKHFFLSTITFVLTKLKA